MVGGIQSILGNMVFKVGALGMRASQWIGVGSEQQEGQAMGEKNSPPKRGIGDAVSPFGEPRFGETQISW